ncbi:MAG: type IV pilus secretin PilQ [Deltaproteobacteria bacterium]|nr:type IV pilus secretin PilQ [Deltaproteobacteria bacterium]
MLAVGFYGCPPGGLIQEEQEPATTPPAMVAQTQTPTEEKPVRSLESIEEATLEDVFKLQDLVVREGRGQTTFHIKFSKPVTQYRHFTLTQPTRIVLDVFGDVKRRAELEDFRIDTSWVNNLRISSSEGYLRVVAEITAVPAPAYVIEPESDGLKMIIGTINPDATAKKDLQLVKGGKRVDVKVAEAKPSAPEAKVQAAFLPGRGCKKKEYTGQRISLDFKDADIKNVFRLLAEISDLNIVVTDDVVRKVTVRLVDVPWDQALEILLDTNGLGCERKNNVVRISTVGRLRAEKDAIKAARDAEERLEPLQASFLNVNYANVADLGEKIKGVLSDRGSVISDERTNTLIIRDIKKNIDNANEIVRRLDTRTPQVLIESNLIETNPTFSRALGVRFQFRRGGTTFASEAPAGSPFSADPASPLGLVLSTIQSRVAGLQDLRSFLEAAEEEGDIRIISRPSVVTLNNVTSTIQSLRIVRVLLPSGTTNIASGTGAAAGAALATQEVNVGIVLTVTPQVSSDGFVLMKINVKSSTLASQPSTGAAIPDELTREAISNVLVRDGETVVIGGIMKDTRSETEAGIPYLKDIPIVGWLFKTIRFQKDFEELMVFITPRIIRGGSQDLPSAEQLWRDSLKKTVGG